MGIDDIIKELQGIKDGTINTEVTLRVNHHYYDITDVYYDGYLDEIIIEHTRRV